MNCGFEDCSVFDELFRNHEGSWRELLEKYQIARKPNGDAIAELALRNFIEMRDKVSDPKFLLQKKIEARFSEKHPDKWIPLYSMVTFSHIPYHEALKKGDRQEYIMQKVMKLPNIEQEWNSDAVEQLILSGLAEGLHH